MKKFLSYALAAVLTVGVIGSSLQTAEAGKRERRIAGGIALGIIGGALIGSAIANDRRYRERRHYRRNHYAPRRDYNHRRVYRRHYNRPVYVQPRAYSEPRRTRRLRIGARHVRWCRNQYRSYRKWDNSFQPYSGGRRACYSPYN